jgi:hypothetical protein
VIRMMVWQRLEPVTRTVEYDRALQARVHDPLWLLGRQWQFGELEGEDAGTPVHVRAEVSSARLARYRAGDAGAAQSYDPDRTPLETAVEREPAGPPTLRTRADAGRRLIAALRAHGAPQTAAGVVRAFPLPAPGSADSSDPETRIANRLTSVLHDRLPDGLAAADALRPSVRPAGAEPPTLPPSVSAPPAEAARALAAAQEFLDWVDAELPPAATSAWVRERLEYRFAVAAAARGGEIILAAPEYQGTELDWHDFDVDGSPGGTLGTPVADAALAPTSTVLDVLASPIVFPGMPADRFWQLEDAAVSLPSVQTAPEDLGRLALVEFATVFGNDWFLVPVPVRYGTLNEVVSLVATDTFGEALLVGAADPTAPPGGHDPALWSMFRLSTRGAPRGAEAIARGLLVPPVVTASTEGAALEDVLFARDEQANLVWAVERVVEGPDGRGRDRNDEWLPVAAALDPPPPPSPAPLAYRLASAVPPHWVPFVAVHDSAENRGVRLERAAMLRLDADPPVPIPPRGRVLEPETARFVLFEEEVPREGVRVVRVPALCRSLDGGTHAWVSRRVTTGREQSSGLRFDLARETGSEEATPRLG